MKQLNLFFFLIALCLFTRCGLQQTEEKKPLQLHISSKVYTDKINSSAVFSSVKCVPLETNADLLIDNIIKIVHRNHFIYVADRFALYKFDEDGMLQGKIKRNGSGPEEYNGISDFEIETEQTAWILSRTDKTLYKYTWDGELKKNIKLNYWATKMYYISPEKVCVYIGNEMDENNRHQLKTIDLNINDVINNHLEIDSKKAKFLHIHSANHFSKVLNRENEMYFFNTFDDMIYKWSNDNLMSVFTININHKNIPPSFYDQDYSDVSVFFQSLFKGNYAYGTDLFIEYEKDYLYAYIYAGERHFTLISKETNEAAHDFKVINEDVILADYPINLVEQNYFVQRNNELILPLIPSDIVNYINDLPDTEIRKKIQERIHYTDEDQNPVLLIMNR
ncbi:MAG: 6-bladed beta-propeller [Prevotellaceae bacterium]|jgi:hypothetical protein|nr:6-bladed beta-propeller [Prevotellaceae bacterium]